ncbi:MAG: aminodeoxychorismate synthase component I [Candidatus Omnitrophota bacterium]
MKLQAMREKDLYNILPSNGRQPFVFLETAIFERENKHSIIFDRCEKILTFAAGDDPKVFFKKIDAFLKKGFWLAGYFTYEFGYLLEERLVSCLPKVSGRPLVWLGVFNRPSMIKNQAYRPGAPIEKERFRYNATMARPNINNREYAAAIRKIKKYIEEGETYQVNFTFQLKFNFAGDSRGLYLDLRRAQPTSYLAFIQTGAECVLSLSPELFFSRDKNKIVVRPMKGTEERGKDLAEDKIKAEMLSNSPKNKAENLMIVDLLRSDLGKIAYRGTVKLNDIFSVEKYRTVFQMTSTVEARIGKKNKYEKIFRALFPSGSVTGAPKIRTMEIIRELEKEPRGVYCGAIGYLAPDDRACFNVAIRTICIDRQRRATMGIGGGIVYDSLAAKEYKEARSKAYFFTKRFLPLSLIETMRWSRKEGYYLLPLHLERLRKSAVYFGIPYERDKIKRRLSSFEQLFDGKTVYKVRLLLNQESGISLYASRLDSFDLPIRAGLSKGKISSKQVYLYHKTTRRGVYDQKLCRGRKRGFSEVVFTNEKGEVTEGCISNVFILQDGTLYTPPVSCGLLPGVLRKYLLTNGAAREKIIYPRDLEKSEKVFLGNSLRGLMEARIVVFPGFI